MPNNHEWLISERLSVQQLEEKLKAYDEKYAGRLVELKKSGDIYRIVEVSVLNQNGIAEYAVNYHPYHVNENECYRNNKHTRPAREFFDGRFMIIA